MPRLSQLLFGRPAFAQVHAILEGLPFATVGERPGGLPHTIFEELWHLAYWQDHLISRLRGEEPAHAGMGEDWPLRQAPADEQEWSGLLDRVMRGLDEAAGVAAEVEVDDRPLAGGHTVRGALEDLLAHNSYHFGRIVALRQLLGVWPPARERD